MSSIISGSPMPLAKTQPSAIKPGFDPKDVDEGLKLGGLLLASGFLPEAIKTKEQAFAIIAAGRELGLPPMQALRSIWLVKGRVTLSADLIVALVKASPECLYWRPTALTDKKVTLVTQRRGDPEPVELTWAIEDAQRAGITNNPTWQKYPRAMLRARCSTELARLVYPDLAMGTYDTDEIREEQPLQRVESPAVVVLHDPQTGEIVDPPPVEEPDPKLARKFMAELRRCTTPDAVAEVASRVAVAKRNGDITPKQRDAVAHVYEEIQAKMIVARDRSDERVAPDDGN